jgi:hypothetical protein
LLNWASLNFHAGIPRMLPRSIRAGFLAFIVASAICEGSIAQGKPTEGAQKSETLKIDAATLAILIKSAIMALQQANQTGNYTVLRDLGTPVFREKFDPARLAAIFANLRSRGINLNPAVVLSPNLSKQPELTPQNELHIVGNFPTQPLQIQYDLVYMLIDGVWRIEGISVDAVPAQPMNSAGVGSPQSPPTQPQSAKPSAANPKKAP